MSILRQFRDGVRVLTNRRAADREIADEMQHFVELSAAEHRKRGLSDAEARRASMVEAGNIAMITDEVRASGWEHTVNTLLRDLRYALRRLRGSPGFTVVAVLSLALGIGANTAIFSLVNATLLRTLPVERPEELVYVENQSGGFSYPDFVELRDNATVPARPLIAWGGITASVGSTDNTQLVSGLIVSGDFFQTLGVRAALGRVITADDDRTPGAHPVIVLSDRYWKQQMGGRRDVIGTSIRFNGHPFTVIGVTPREFEGPVMGVQRDMYVPMMMQAIARPPRGGYSGEMNPDLLQARRSRWLSVATRLSPGTAPAQLMAQLTNIVEEQERRDGTASTTASGRVPLAGVIPIDDRSVGNRAQIISVSRLSFAVVGAILLIACLNVANLLLARANTRRKEIAVRLALGAGRGRLLRQLLTESVVLSMTGGLAGLLLAWGAIAALRAFPPPAGALPITIDFAFDSSVLLFTLGLALVTGIAFGLVPAFRASRPDLVPALKDLVQQERVRRLSGRNALVVLQVGLSLIILVAAGLFLRSFQHTSAISPGFDTERIVSANVNINLLRYTRVEGRQFYRDLLARVEALPGVEAAALSRWLPLTGNNAVRNVSIEGRDIAATRAGDNATGFEPGTMLLQTVSPGYFRTLGIPVLQGRAFEATDDSGATLVAIVNEAFVNHYLGGGAALGQRFNSGAPGAPWIEIVGVTPDIRVSSLNEVPAPLAYVPLLQNHETGVVLQVRSSAANPASLVTPVGRVLRELEPDLPAPTVRPLTQTLATSLYPARVGARMLLGFGALALALAALGLYGVISYAVSRRTRDLGIRMALGAKPQRILGEIIGEGALLVAIGAVGGVVAALFLTRLLRGFLFGIAPTDAATYASTVLVLLVVALCASFIPARRATRIDPLRALREE